MKLVLYSLSRNSFHFIQKFIDLPVSVFTTSVTYWLNTLVIGPNMKVEWNYPNIQAHVDFFAQITC